MTPHLSLSRTLTVITDLIIFLIFIKSLPPPPLSLSLILSLSLSLTVITDLLGIWLFNIYQIFPSPSPPPPPPSLSLSLWLNTRTCRVVHKEASSWRRWQQICIDFISLPTSCNSDPPPQMTLPKSIYVHKSAAEEGEARFGCSEKAREHMWVLTYHTRHIYDCRSL